MKVLVIIQYLLIFNNAITFSCVLHLSFPVHRLSLIFVEMILSCVNFYILLLNISTPFFYSLKSFPFHASKALVQRLDNYSPFFCLYSFIFIFKLLIHVKIIFHGMNQIFNFYPPNHESFDSILLIELPILCLLIGDTTSISYIT